VSRPGKRSITFYTDTAVYEQIKQTAEQLELTITDYLIGLHTRFATDKLTVDEKLDLIMKQLNIPIQKAEAQNDALTTSLSMDDEKSENNTQLNLELNNKSNIISKNYSGKQINLYRKYSKILDPLRTQRQRNNYVLILELLEKVGDLGISLQEARAHTSSVAKSVLEHLESEGIVQSVANRFYLKT
jgi:hypothetical protein